MTPSKMIYFAPYFSFHIEGHSLEKDGYSHWSSKIKSCYCQVFIIEMESVLFKGWKPLRMWKVCTGAVKRRVDSEYIQVQYRSLLQSYANKSFPGPVRFWFLYSRLKVSISITLQNNYSDGFDLALEDVCCINHTYWWDQRSSGLKNHGNMTMLIW